MKARNAIGTAATAVYCALVIGWSCHRWDQMIALAPNELGDFLAGVFGPLAFMWLVFGYLQQGDELQQNTKALEMQARELENSVKHQAELVEVTRQQIQADISSLQEEQRRQAAAAKPRFRFSPHGHITSGGQTSLTFRCVNAGNTAVDLHIHYSGNGVSVRPGVLNALARGEYVDFIFEVPSSFTLPESFTIEFTDAAGVSDVADFTVERGRGGPYDWTFSEQTDS